MRGLPCEDLRWGGLPYGACTGYPLVNYASPLTYAMFPATLHLLEPYT